MFVTDLRVIAIVVALTIYAAPQAPGGLVASDAAVRLAVRGVKVNCELHGIK